jgi:hypothetical protein
MNHVDVRILLQIGKCRLMKTKIISELKNGLAFPRSRGEAAAQEQMRIFRQAIERQNVQFLRKGENLGRGRIFIYCI